MKKEATKIWVEENGIRNRSEQEQQKLDRWLPKQMGLDLWLRDRGEGM